MAINTFDQALAGMQNPRFLSYASATGFTYTAGHFYNPNISTNNNKTGGMFGSQQAANTSIVGGTALSSSSSLVIGQIPHYDPVSGNAYIAKFQIQFRQPMATVILADRLWECGANTNGLPIDLTQTNTQGINSVTWPARDNNGTSNGAGVHVAVEINSTAGPGNPTSTITYVNSDGKTGMQGINVQPWITSSGQSSFYPISLGNTEVGIQNVTSFALSASVSFGGAALVAYRPLTSVDCASTTITNPSDILSSFVPLYNGTVPFIIHYAGATQVGSFDGIYQETRG